MTHTSITSPPHSSHMYTFLQTLQNLFKPPRNNSSISLFHVNSFEILKYVTKAKQKRKRKRQGKRKEKKKEKERNRRSEKKENKLEEYLLFSTPPSLSFPSIRYSRKANGIRNPMKPKSNDLDLRSWRNPRSKIRKNLRLN